MNLRNKRITSYFILFSLMIVLGVIYAILQANLQINGTAKISKNEWNVHFDHIVVNPNSVAIGTDDTAATIDPSNNCKVDFSVTLSLPGDFYEFTVDVVNAGSINAMIGTLTKTLKVNNVLVETVPDYLIYTVTYDGGDEILENHLLASGDTETYKIRIEFRRDIDSLPQDTVTISTSVEPVFLQADSEAIAVIHPTIFSLLSMDAVLDSINSTYVQNDVPGIDFTKMASDTNGKGLYLRKGTENDTYPIYYYRGAVENNNVLFGGFCWKIIRTTETGGLKIIYNGIPSNGTCGTGSTSQLYSLIGDSSFAQTYNNTKYLGYTYDNSGVEVDSAVKTKVDTWYQNNLLTNYDSYIEDTVFCNDRSAHAFSEFTIEEQTSFYLENSYTIYGPSYRYFKKLGPMVTCPNIDDAYTKSDSLGNGKLIYPVGLPTSDEICLAGEGSFYMKNQGINYPNQTFYLQNNYNYLSMSPCLWDGSGGTVWYGEFRAGLTDTYVDNLVGVRPVISIKPNAKLISGDGTGENPYTVE